MEFQDLSSENRPLYKMMGPRPSLRTSRPGLGIPTQIPFKGGTNSSTGSTSPWQENPESLKAAATACTPKPSAHTRRSRAVTHPCAKRVQGGGRVGGHMQLSWKRKHHTLTLKLQ